VSRFRDGSRDVPRRNLHRHLVAGRESGRAARSRPGTRPANLSEQPRLSRVDEIPSRVIGRFELFEQLGRGGFGEVYRAFDPKLHREVAIKIVRAEHADRARVLAEARAAAGLQHPHVVTVFEVDEVDDICFIVMELVRGHTLRQRLHDASVEQKVEWLGQLAGALAAAHAKGIVHRDVKLENVLIVDGSQTAKLVDFGIAKSVAGTHETTLGRTAFDPGPKTEHGHVRGTPRYLAPELLAGEPASFAADQWSWGIVAFQLLAGKHPADLLGGPPHVGWALVNAPPSLATVAADLPAVVCNVVDRALARDPTARSRSMAEVVAALTGAPRVRLGDTRLSNPEVGAARPSHGESATNTFDVAVPPTAVPVAAAAPPPPPPQPPVARPSQPRAQQMPARQAAPLARRPVAMPAPGRPSHPHPAAVRRPMQPPPKSGSSMTTAVLVGLAVLLACGIFAAGCLFLVLVGRR